MSGDLKSLLRDKLTSEEIAIVYKSYDVVGDIAVIRIPEPILGHRETIAEALMLQHKHVKAVWRQSSPVSGGFRLRELEWLRGEKETETVHKEHGCLFKVDIKDCYFSPRLAFERMRIANLVSADEVVVNMFAGVGCYSITIAKHSGAARVFSIDINPVAVRYMRENALLNKVVDRVLPLEGDARTVIEKTLRKTANRVIMPLPEKAYEYLDTALCAVKPEGGYIHLYCFEHAKKGESPVEKAKSKVAEKLRKRNVIFELPFARIVRQTGPNWYQLVTDIKVERLRVDTG